MIHESCQVDLDETLEAGSKEGGCAATDPQHAASLQVHDILVGSGKVLGK